MSYKKISFLDSHLSDEKIIRKKLKSIYYLLLLNYEFNSNFTILGFWLYLFKIIL